MHVANMFIRPQGKNICGSECPGIYIIENKIYTQAQGGQMTLQDISKI